MANRHGCTHCDAKKLFELLARKTFWLNCCSFVRPARARPEPVCATTQDEGEVTSSYELLFCFGVVLSLGVVLGYLLAVSCPHGVRCVLAEQREQPAFQRAVQTSYEQAACQTDPPEHCEPRVIQPCEPRDKDDNEQREAPYGQPHEMLQVLRWRHMINRWRRRSFRRRAWAALGYLLRQWKEDSK